MLFYCVRNKYGSQWDKTEPDDGGMKEFLFTQLEAAAGRDDSE